MALRPAILLRLVSFFQAAWAEAACRNSSTKGAFYLQIQRQQGVTHSKTEAVSWATGPFGDCIVECSVPLQRRSVQCRTMHDGPAEDMECEGMQRPANTKACDCSTMLCVSEASKACEEQHAKDFNTRLTSDASEELQQDMAECLGCFPLSDDELHESPDAYNDSCVRWDSESPCRSGLPFYSMRSPDLDTSLCQSFCTSKGLDLSGIVGGKECRCGASRLNRAVWMGGEPRPGLLLPSEPMSGCRTEHRESCPMRVYRLRGPFPSFGVPPTHLQLSAQDISYMDSIVSGETRDVPKESSVDPDLASPSATAPSLVTSDYLPPWVWRRCDGYGSCGAAQNWRPRSAPTSGEWEEVAFVHFYFDGGYGMDMDQTRKEAFREATARYHRRTCIRFVEVEPNFTGVRLRVANDDPSSCWATMGYHNTTWGYFKGGRFNLGSCMNLNHLGEIIHNLGHVLGMLDEQQRPDATRAYYGHGPHLQVFWDNIPSRWMPSFTASEGAYTGSRYDGARDPWFGHAPYDFDSIMHFTPTLYGSHLYETIPSAKMQNVGQRNRLSEGDVLQLLDSYRCRRRTTTTTTTTAATTTTTTTSMSSGAGGCIQNPDCAVNPRCNDPSYQSWCPIHQSPCPEPWCVGSQR